MPERLLTYMCMIGLAAIVLFGCEDRGPNDPNRQTSTGGPYAEKHDFYDELKIQIGRVNEGSTTLQRVTLDLRGYIPEGSWGTGVPIRDVPVLILLAPQDGDHFYYINHGLMEIADELIGSGEIIPMAVICVPNDNLFVQSYFYAGDAAQAGFYDYFIGGSFIDWLKTGGTDFMNDSLPLGIGGVGLGGYGAFRAALLHEGRFASVSVTDGPYDFDGDATYSGLDDLFDDVLLEQGLLNFSDPDTSWTQVFDTAGAWHLSRLFVGGALAFSPSDSIDTTGVLVVINNRFRIDIPDSQRVPIFTDSSSLITEVVKLDQHNFDFHVPFDSTGAAVPEIWQEWLTYNLENVLANYPTALDSVQMWIGTTQEWEFGNYYDQTQAWIQTLNDNGYGNQLEVHTYTGYPGNPATNDRYVHELLREMLIFHSRAFEAAMSQ